MVKWKLGHIATVANIRHLSTFMTTTTPTICLAMMARDEANIISTSLNSAIPYIDSWVLFDYGSRDSTLDKVSAVLVDVPGQLEKRIFKGFSESRNALLTQASAAADFVLMLDADETIGSFRSQITLPHGVDVGFIEVAEHGYSTRQPRLFRAGADCRYQFHVSEQLGIHSDATAFIDTEKIIHHRNGYRHRHTSTVGSDLAFVKAELIHHPQSSHLQLALAKCYLRNRRFADALPCYNKVIECAEDGEHIWQALYFSANIYLSNSNDNSFANPPLGLQRLQQCFDLDPTRGEPLMRLCEVFRDDEQLEKATEINEVLLDFKQPSTALYFEPYVYAAGPLLLQAELAYSMDDQQQLELAIRSLKDCRLSVGEQNRLDLLKPPSTTFARYKQPRAQKNKKVATPKLTFGMATYDDYYGVYFTIMSLVLYHRECLDQIEILVIDNHPTSKHGSAVKDLCARVRQAKYIPASEYSSTAIRERVFIEALGEYVVCADCHVFLHQGALSALIKYYEQNPDSSDLLHGPLVYDNNFDIHTHMVPKWRVGFFGTWSVDDRGKNVTSDAFEIPMQGLGLFSCRRDSWPGFNVKFRGFGGEEGYIHEKFRRGGAKVLCLPALRWTHRFDRPDGTQYVNQWKDRIRNYLIGWHELGIDPEPGLRHFENQIGFAEVAAVNGRFQTEVRSPFWQFDAIFCITLEDSDWAQLTSTLEFLTIDQSVQRIHCEESSLSSSQRYANRTNQLVKFARRCKLYSILIINGTQVLQRSANSVLSNLVRADNSLVIPLAELTQVDDRPHSVNQPSKIYLFHSPAH